MLKLKKMDVLKIISSWWVPEYVYKAVKPHGGFLQICIVCHGVCKKWGRQWKQWVVYAWIYQDRLLTQSMSAQ